MARTPNEEVERLRQVIPIEDRVRASGVALTGHGANLVGLCPFHPETTPSLIVTPAKGLFRCMGCGAAGSIFDWEMKTQRVGFKKALALLRADAPAVAVPSGRLPKRSTVTKLPPPAPLDAGDQELFNAVVADYEHSFQTLLPPQRYLQSRGLDDAELFAHSRPGYANRTLGYQLPLKNRNAGADLRGRLTKLGFLRATGHEHLAGSVTVPIFDEHGNAVGMYGRKITPRLRAGTPLHLYLPGPHRGLWNWQALRASEQIILCEAPFDAMTFWRWGFRSVTFAYGVEGFTEEMLEAFTRHGIKVVYIAFDPDEAGNRGALKVQARLAQVGIGAYRIEFPKGVDANLYPQKVTPAERAFALIIRAARWMGSGKPPPMTIIPEPPIEVRSECMDEDEPKNSPPPDDHPLAAESLPLAAPAPATTAETSPPTAPVPTLVEQPSTSAKATVDMPTIQVETFADGIVMTIGDRRYRVRGLEKNTSYEQLNVNLKVMRGRDGSVFHQDSLNLYKAPERARFIKAAAIELAVEEPTIKKDLGKVLLKLEELQHEHIQTALQPKEKTVTLTAAAEASALGFLRATNLIDLIKQHFLACGIVGEVTNLIVAFLAAVSRLLEKPLGILIQSSSAAGKTTLMDAILAFLPDEVKVRYSALTGQALFYMSNVNLEHKVLGISEEEGAANAAYALKLLASEGELSIASTGKDPQTGKLITQEYRVKGPIALFSTTTAVDLDEELKNRCITLAIDESREQTQRIHRQQRFERTLEGIRQRQERARIRELEQNAQRLLKPLLVYNPFAQHLSFADKETTARRDHTKYLALMDAIALLHQHQRPRKTLAFGGSEPIECVVVTREDVQLANELANDVLGRYLSELAPHTRRLLVQIHKMVAENSDRLGIERSDYRFSRRQVREYTGIGHSQLALHMKRLEELEYVIVHHAKRGQSFNYELVYDGEGQQGEKFMLGLFDPEKHVLSSVEGLDDRPGCSGDLPGFFEGCPVEKGNLPGSIRPQSGANPGAIRGGGNGSEPLGDKAESDFEPETPENAYTGSGNGTGVRRSRSHAPLLAAAREEQDNEE
jgi:DNA primase